MKDYKEITCEYSASFDFLEDVENAENYVLRNIASNLCQEMTNEELIKLFGVKKTDPRVELKMIVGGFARKVDMNSSHHRELVKLIQMGIVRYTASIKV